MTDRKKRILMCTESSFLASGFSVYSMEVQKRLHATGKYEIAELGCYGEPNDKRAAELPWKFYSNVPESPDLFPEYELSPINQFGAWRFEQTCLDFRPDIIWCIGDHWSTTFIENSPFRPYYYWTPMAPVDSAPQNEQWMATYMTADKVLTYSDWGLELLKKEGGGLIKTFKSAPAGNDLDVFKPIENKSSHKRAWNLPPDMLIVGTVMRNQERKLYPELMQAFARFLKEAPESLAQKTYLYFHTTYPDMGWNIPFLLKETGIGHKVLMTYVCENCGYASASFFQDARGVCRRCDQYTAVLPNTNRGVDRATLAQIINLFDIYVQYSTNEGQGLPQGEAAACGVPVMATDYSAMSDVVRKLKGFPIKVRKLRHDIMTDCFRAEPDEDNFLQQLIRFLKMPETMRHRKRFEARKAAQEHYDWNKTTKVWEEVFDSLRIRPDNETWDSPPRLHKPNLQIPSGMSNEEFIRWSMYYILGRPDLVDSYFATRLVRDLNWNIKSHTIGPFYFNEASVLGERVQMKYRFGRGDAIEEMLKIRNHANLWEARRCKITM